MRTINVVKALRNQGHSVSYVTRADGGVRIYSVDGIKFSKSNSDGNNYARELADLNLTDKQYSQRRESGDVALRLTKARKVQRLPSISRKKTDKPKVATYKQEVRKAMRKLNKLLRSQREKPFDPIKLRQRIQRQGYGETLKTIHNIMFKKSGIAYPRAVESFIEHIDELTQKYDSEDLNNLVERTKQALARATNLIMDSTLYHLYEEFYDIEKALRDSPDSMTTLAFVGTGWTIEKEIDDSFALALSLTDF